MGHLTFIQKAGVDFEAIERPHCPKAFKKQTDVSKYYTTVRLYIEQVVGSEESIEQLCCVTGNFIARVHSKEFGFLQKSQSITSFVDFWSRYEFSLDVLLSRYSKTVPVTPFLLKFQVDAEDFSLVNQNAFLERWLDLFDSKIDASPTQKNFIKVIEAFQNTFNIADIVLDKVPVVFYALVKEKDAMPASLNVRRTWKEVSRILRGEFDKLRENRSNLVSEIKDNGIVCLFCSYHHALAHCPLKRYLWDHYHSSVEMSDEKGTKWKLDHSTWEECEFPALNKEFLCEVSRYSVLNPDC